MAFGAKVILARQVQRDVSRLDSGVSSAQRAISTVV
jgi:hypothetical protein